MKVTIIADVGSNFCGSFDKAMDYLEVSAEIGIDIVKFQTWTADTLLSPHHPGYDNIKGQKYGLPLEWHEKLLQRAKRLGVEFMTTPTQPEHVDFLEEIGVSRYKIASGDLNFVPLLKAVEATGKPVIISSGMAYSHEIAKAVSHCSGCSQIVVMHCVSKYPPLWNEMNLRALGFLRRFLPSDVDIGLSDHSSGCTAAIAAVALGARWIEKHITFSKDFTTPDAPFALNIEEFKELVRQIRITEEMLGKEEKVLSPAEVTERFWARRGVYARDPMEKGTMLNEKNLVCLRPAKGVGVEEIGLLIGKRLNKDVDRGEPIFWDMVE